MILGQIQQLYHTDFDSGNRILTVKHKELKFVMQFNSRLGPESDAQSWIDHITNTITNPEVIHFVYTIMQQRNVPVVCQGKSTIDRLAMCLKFGADRILDDWFSIMDRHVATSSEYLDCQALRNYASIISKHPNRGLDLDIMRGYISFGFSRHQRRISVPLAIYNVEANAFNELEFLPFVRVLRNNNMFDEIVNKLETNVLREF